MSLQIKRSPEQEAYRIKRLREVMARPRSKKWRANQSKGIRRAIAEGRLPVARSRESIERGAAKLRGRKRPPEVVEKIRQRHLGTKRGPETLAKLCKRALRDRELNRGIFSPESRAKVAAAHARIMKGRPMPPACLIAGRKALAGIKWAPEIVESRAMRMRGRPQTAKATKKGPTNQLSLSGTLRSKENILYPFRNLTHFVREHPDLFDPADIEWKREKRSGKGRRQSRISCNAQKRLLALFGHGKVVPGSWKGWTVYSFTEHALNDGQDLLQRPDGGFAL